MSDGVNSLVEAARWLHAEAPAFAEAPQVSAWSHVSADQMEIGIKLSVPIRNEKATHFLTGVV